MSRGWWNLHYSLVKWERNKLVREYHASNPSLSYAKLAQIFMISRQRIERIINVPETDKQYGKD